jgi:5-methylcytosine-specific restriction protein B
MGMAYKQATGVAITGTAFEGGKNTPCFKRFEELGFNIIPKVNPQSHFMNTNHILTLACTAKPFTILAGGTGTGKTRAAKLAAVSISGISNVEVVAVGADWTDNRPLLGFRNLLAEGGKTYVAPPALRIILKALANPGKPHFLILDEMNLSHVERYFADFLSSMESKEPLKLHDSAGALKTEDGILVEGKVPWPNNLFVIGTVNIDETTYMFSPKVLDRAHVIEFKVAWDEIEDGLEGAVPNEEAPLKPEQVQEFMRVAQMKDKVLPEEDHEALIDVLRDMHEALEGTRFVFAHRTARECLIYIASAQSLAKADIIPPQDTKELIDVAILQKALPKLNGATGTLSKILDDLIKVADKHDLTRCKDKLASMSRQLKADQFVSFIQ